MKLPLEDILANRNNLLVEFKRNIDVKVEDYISAFANTEGGYLVFGVEDGGAVIGISDSQRDDFSKRLLNICKNMSAFCDIYADSLNQKLVLILYVHPKTTKFSVRTSEGKAFIRVNERIQPLTDDEAKQIIKNTEATIRCFVAMSFRKQEYPHLEDYYDAMVRAADKCAYKLKVEKNDENPFNGDAVDKIKQNIMDCHFMLADYTLCSPNVFYEQGYAEGIGKETIQTCENNTELPFDVNHNNTYFYANAHQLEEQLVVSFNEICGRIKI